MTEFSDVESVASAKSKLTNQIHKLAPNDLDSNQDIDRDEEDQSGDDNINSDHEISDFSEISFELTDKEKAEV